MLVLGICIFLRWTRSWGAGLYGPLDDCQKIGVLREHVFQPVTNCMVKKGPNIKHISRVSMRFLVPWNLDPKFLFSEKI